MRLLTTKALYRAFPELDHFSDEQCRTFVNAAKRGLIARFIREFIQLLTVPIAFAFVGWVCILIANSLALPSRDQHDLLFYLVASLVMFVSFVAAAMAYLFTRDLLLRSRIRSIMLLRGSCTECGYGLTGLPVTIDHSGSLAATDRANTSNLQSVNLSPSNHVYVICPECGTPHDGHTSLGEVIADEKGTLRYIPSTNAPARLRQDRTARTLRRLIKPALYTLAAAFLLACLTAGGYELFLRRQAAAARADLLTPANLAAEMAAVFPDLPSPENAPRPLPIERARSIAGAMETARIAAFPNETGPATQLDFDVVAPLSTSLVKHTLSAETFARITLVSTTVYTNLMAGGLDRDLDALSTVPPVLAMPIMKPTGTAVMFPIFHPLYWDFQFLLTANAARARLAIQGTDPEPFAKAIKTQVGILNHSATIPDLGAALISRRHHSVAIDLATRAVHQHRTRDWIDAIEKALATSPDFVSGTDIDRVSRLLGRHTIAQIFADPSNVRLGRYSPLFRSMLPFIPGNRVGTYSGSLDEYEGLPAATQVQDVDFFQHPILIQPRIERFAVGWVGRTVSYWIDYKTGSIAHTRALPLFLAIERYLLDNNRLPETLDALIPKYLDVLPIDPFTGKPLLFRPSIDQSNPDKSRSYSIYSAGRNQIDDGGDFGVARYQGLNLSPNTNDIRLITMPPPK